MGEVFKKNEVTEHERRDKELFDSIATKYVRKDLDPAARVARTHRLRQTLGELSASLRISVLEVGCGAGYAATYLRGSYAIYEGIDYSRELIQYAEKTNTYKNTSFRAINVKDLEEGQTFDVIFMIGVLHHLDRAEEIVRKLKTHLSPGGRLVANEPHQGNPLISAMRHFRKRFDADYSADQREYREAELYDLFKRAGYSDITVSPQGFFSTPFAEVIVPPRSLILPLVTWTCRWDKWLESRGWHWLTRFSWNLVVQGRR